MAVVRTTVRTDETDDNMVAVHATVTADATSDHVHRTAGDVFPDRGIDQPRAAGRPERQRHRRASARSPAWHRYQRSPGHRPACPVCQPVAAVASTPPPVPGPVPDGSP